MKLRSPLRFDFNNLFAPVMADGPIDLSFFQKSFRTAHSGIKVFKSTGHLPFAALPTDTIALTHIQDAAAKCEDFEAVVVLGIGGSALGLSSLELALRGPLANLGGGKRLFVVDNIDPDLLEAVFAQVSAKKSLYVFVSKSGETTETLTQYLFFKSRGALTKQNVFIITDPQKGFLRKLALAEGYASLSIPVGVGGRFSVFTAVALFPLAVLGVDVADILEGAEHGERACRMEHLEQNPAGIMAAVLHFWMKQRGFSQIVMMPYSERLRLFSDWFAQLWGESLGKRYALNQQEVFAGSTPIKSVGVTDQHSLLQLFLDGPRDKLLLFLKTDQFAQAASLGTEKSDDAALSYLCGKTAETILQAEREATQAALCENGRPNATLSLGKINAFELGQLYQVMMNVMPYMGIFEDINPYDQPAVQRIKDYTGALLGRKANEADLAKLKNKSVRKDLVF
jgi:glucose-6-phosphate isomerase